MSKSGMNKESTKIRRQINRKRRHIVKRILRIFYDESKLEKSPKTSGWESW